MINMANVDSIHEHSGMLLARSVLTKPRITSAHIADNPNGYLRVISPRSIKLTCQSTKPPLETYITGKDKTQNKTSIQPCRSKLRLLQSRLRQWVCKAFLRHNPALFQYPRPHHFLYLYPFPFSCFPSFQFTVTLALIDLNSLPSLLFAFVINIQCL